MIRLKSRFANGIVHLLGWLFSIGFAFAIIAVVVAVFVFNYYGRDLPNYDQLEKYDPATVTRFYAADGKFLAEYATEKRVFVPLSAIPRLVINAFLSAEDKNFYNHKGIDYTGIARAIRNNIKNYGQGKSLVGGSTITQQVVKNFLLTNEKSFERKIKEAILAMRISQTYSKDKILELYLNEIYLGLGSYGVAAAAQNYFNKSLDELTVEEAALLAAEPKSPSQYNPNKFYKITKERRDWVIDRMKEDGHITQADAALAKQTEIKLKNRDTAEVARADFFAEEVRRTIADMYGSEVLYGGGLVVKTTLVPEMQKMADNALRKALIDYDRRRGYRGVIKNISGEEDWKKSLMALTKEHFYHLLPNQKLAVVFAMDDSKANIHFDDDKKGVVPVSLLRWTKAGIRKPANLFKIGDVIIVQPVSDDEAKTIGSKKTASVDMKTTWNLAQVPEVNGALVVLDPHTGRVLAMSGGYSYGGTEFNRATQAKRQPGSSFKPFVYMAALENGFAPNTIILDAPVSMSQGEGQDTWRPANYHDEYLGPTTMRVGLEKSRNTMTVRIAQSIGIDKVQEIAKRFGIYEDPPPYFSMVLGSFETTLLRMVNAYGMIANGGRKITPTLIERIDDRHGKTIYRRDNRTCGECKVEDSAIANVEVKPPELADIREQVVDPRINYQITSMLNGVTVRGTAARAKEIGKVVAGKTGTTNDSYDTWFVGFSPDLVAGVYIGYDKPKTLGKKETGGSVALPAFITFMKEALANVPNKPFNVPSGIKLVALDLYSGSPLGDFNEEELGDVRVIEEAFIGGNDLFLPNPESRGFKDGIVTGEDVNNDVNIDGVENESEALPANTSGSGLY